MVSTPSATVRTPSLHGVDAVQLSRGRRPAIARTPSIHHEDDVGDRDDDVHPS
jgi:hypothetical protein